MTKFAAGVQDWTEDEYLADKHCPQPSLSHTSAKTLLDLSPLHAWVGSRRLNDEFEDAPSQTFDIGHAVHKLYLTKGRELEVINAKDFKTAAAKAARDNAYAANRIPLTVEQFNRVSMMREAGAYQLARHDVGNIFERDLPTEVSIAWQQGEVWNRARIDVLDEPNRVAYDLKSTEGDANPERLNRLIANFGYDTQATHYLDGLKTILGGEWRFRFVIQEKSDPFLLSVVELSPDWIETGRRKINRARMIWRHCLDENNWPGYPSTICVLDAPQWSETQWYEREVREDQLRRQHGRDVIDLAMKWQAPTG